MWSDVDVEWCRCGVVSMWSGVDMSGAVSGVDEWSGVSRSSVDAE